MALAHKASSMHSSQLAHRPQHTPVSLLAAAARPKPASTSNLQQASLRSSLSVVPRAVKPSGGKRDDDSDNESSAAPAAPQQQPDIAADAEAAIENAAASASDALQDASDAATALVQDAANVTSGLVSDAADAAEATVTAAAQTASNIVSDAADATTAFVDDAEAAWRSAADSVRAAATPGGPIDWSVGVGATPDPRFKGLKVLVVGATGGVGRRVVAALRAKGVPCRALVRDRARAANLLPQPSAAAAASSTSSSTSSGPAPPEFEIATGDVYQYATLPPALRGCNAVIVASGANDKADPLGPFNVDYNGNLNLIAAAKAAGVKHFVLVTSIGTDDILNPLNLFWGILFWKKRAEEALQRSGLPHTIVRPGGLKSKLGPGETSAGNIVMGRAGSYGFPPLQKSGAILRSQVADVCVEALVCRAAEGKVVEIIAEKEAPAAGSIEALFEGVSMTWP